MAGLLSTLAQQGQVPGNAMPQGAPMPQRPAQPPGLPMRPNMFPRQAVAAPPMQQMPASQRSAVPPGNVRQGGLSVQGIMDLARQVIMSPGGAQAIKGMIIHDGNMARGIATAICNVTKVIMNTLQKNGMRVSPPLLAQAIIGIADLVLITVVKMGMLQPQQAKTLAHPVLELALQLWQRSMPKPQRAM